MTTSPSKITPCIWLDHQAEQAATFYSGAFPKSRVIATSRYPESSDNPAGRPRGSVLTVEFEIAGQRFTVVNGGPLFVVNPSVSFFVHVDSPQEADRLFAALVDGGQALMPIDAYPWSERYGWVKDRFGVSWQVTSGRKPEGGAVIVPCLMFAGAMRGHAEEAMRFYTSTFPGGTIDRIERYAEGQGPTRMVKHGRFTVAGNTMVAMDPHIDNGFTFNEALSFQVMCDDQAEVDHYWKALAEGGEPGQCGWLKDRFGVSWQVVPTAITKWMTSTDADAQRRALDAIWQMEKPDIATLERAIEAK